MSLSRFRVFTDTELACLWYALRWEDGRMITPQETDKALVGELKVETDARDLLNSDLLVLWERDVSDAEAGKR